MWKGKWMVWVSYVKHIDGLQGAKCEEGKKGSIEGASNHREGWLDVGTTYFHYSIAFGTWVCPSFLWCFSVSSSILYTSLSRGMSIVAFTVICLVVVLSNHKYTDTRQYFTMFHPLRFPDEQRGRRTAFFAEKTMGGCQKRAASTISSGDSYRDSLTLWPVGGSLKLKLSETHWLAQVRVPELTLWPRYMRYHEIPLGSFKVSGILSFCSVSWSTGPPDSRSCTDCSCAICHHKHGGMLQHCVLRFFDASQDKADAKRKPCDKCSRRVDLWVS